MLPELPKEQIDMTNTFKSIKLTPYRLIAAGAGAKNVPLPDGTVIDCDDIKRELGYPQLFAWNLEPKPLLEWVQYKNEHPECPCDLVVDSGAYSMWSRRKEFDIDQYINFLNTNKVIETCFWAAEADVIPGKFGVDPTEDERRDAPEQSWNNYLYMIKRVKMPKKIVPIFHMGEDYSHLKRMLEYRFEDGDHIPYIGLSPRNDVHVNEKIKWYEAVWKIIKDSSNPNVLTHNFGCTTISIMEQFPSCSSDSTSWIRSASFGNIMLVLNGKVKTVTVSNRQALTDDHINNQPLAVKEAVSRMCDKIGHGITLESLTGGDDRGNLRMIFNIYSLNMWKQSFEYIGDDTFKEELW